MKLEIESTEKIVVQNGIPARIWNGKTAAGVPVTCYIAHVAVDRSEDSSELDRELREVDAPRTEVVEFLARRPWWL
jgi:hypothetical protein